MLHPGRVLLPLGLGTALSLMGDATLYTVLPTHTAAAGITLSGVGIILSANRIIRLFLNGPTGVAYDRSPRRGLFITALFIGVLSTIIYAATSGFWPLLAGRLLWGVAWAGIWVGGTTIILDVTTDQDRGRWTGLYQTWFFLGAAFGAFSGGVLTDWLGFTTTMWIAAAVSAIGGLAALFFLPETQPKTNPLKGSLVKGKLPGPRSNPRLWIAASVQGINRFVTAGVLAATIALLVQDRAATFQIALGVATMTGILLGYRTVLSMISAPMAGSLSDRLGGRWLVTLGGLLLGALGMFLMVRPDPGTLIIGISLTAISGGSVQTLVTALTGDLVIEAQRGRAIGLLHTAGDLGSALGPITAYALLPWIQLTGVYILCAGVLTFGAVMALWVFRSERHHASRPGV